MSVENSRGVINDFSWKVKLVNWIKTTRVQTALVTALALWVGYLTVQPLGIQSALLLGVIGLLVHIWGFTLNEVEDYKYDARAGDAGGHPIAQGKVHAGVARYLAWISAFTAVGISALTPYGISATLVLLGSFLPGYLYDKYSKKHWWSNLYLSVWAAMMVLAGGLYAGMPNLYTTLMVIAVSIQIFVQVIEGDLKDILGPENTLAEELGVRIKKVEGTIYDMDDMIESREYKGSESCMIVQYSRCFTGLVYGLKVLEVAILSFLAYSWVSMYGVGITPFPDGPHIYYTVFMVTAIAFFSTLSFWMVYCFDRDEIKQKSSLHELTSILLLGITVYPISPYGALLVGVLPMVWYGAVNYVIHSGTLNPDI